MLLLVTMPHSLQSHVEIHDQNMFGLHQTPYK